MFSKPQVLATLGAIASMQKTEKHLTKNLSELLVTRVLIGPHVERSVLLVKPLVTCSIELFWVTLSHPLFGLVLVQTIYKST